MIFKINYNIYIYSYFFFRYLYYNGGMVRFMPKDDIRVILPRIFVDNDVNKAFIKNKDLDETIKRMAANLIDKEFDIFQGS